MKKLQSFESLAIPENELKMLSGGQNTPISGSSNLLGSNLSYSGNLSMTADTSTSIMVLSGTSYVSDFCGTMSYDGGTVPGCAQFYNGSWHILGL